MADESHLPHPCALREREGEGGETEQEGVGEIVRERAGDRLQRVSKEADLLTHKLV